jgi:hypothetical protein
MKEVKPPIELMLVPTAHCDAGIVGFHEVAQRLAQIDRRPALDINVH